MICQIHFSENCTSQSNYSKYRRTRRMEYFSRYCCHSVSWMVEESWCDSLQEQEIYLFFTASRQSLVSTQPMGIGNELQVEFLPHTVSLKVYFKIISPHPCLGLPSGLFPSGLPSKILYAPFISPIFPTFPDHLVLQSWSPRYHLMSENHETLHYAMSISLLWLFPFMPMCLSYHPVLIYPQTMFY